MFVSLIFLPPSRTCLTSACAFFITFGFLNNSDIAHSIVDAEVSLAAVKTSCKRELNHNDIVTCIFSTQQNNST